MSNVQQTTSDQVASAAGGHIALLSARLPQLSADPENPHSFDRALNMRIPTMADASWLARMRIRPFTDRRGAQQAPETEAVAVDDNGGEIPAALAVQAGGNDVGAVIAPPEAGVVAEEQVVAGEQVVAAVAAAPVHANPVEAAPVESSSSSSNRRSSRLSANGNKRAAIVIEDPVRTPRKNRRRSAAEVDEEYREDDAFSTVGSPVRASGVSGNRAASTSKKPKKNKKQRKSN